MACVPDGHLQVVLVCKCERGLHVANGTGCDCVRRQVPPLRRIAVDVLSAKVLHAQAMEAVRDAPHVCPFDEIPRSQVLKMHSGIYGVWGLRDVFHVFHEIGTEGSVGKVLEWFAGRIDRRLVEHAHAFVHALQHIGVGGHLVERGFRLAEGCAKLVRPHSVIRKASVIGLAVDNALLLRNGGKEVLARRRRRRSAHRRAELVLWRGVGEVENRDRGRVGHEHRQELVEVRSHKVTRQRVGREAEGLEVFHAARRLRDSVIVVKQLLEGDCAEPLPIGCHKRRKLVNVLDGRRRLANQVQRLAHRLVDLVH
mmetsp:Transcript_18685/g.59521  ORF Transcript_18685/g.59521 Transcript_18685/m.59521 type:complete len:311 (+) Transcript_18685:1982-2914(+)